MRRFLLTALLVLPACGDQGGGKTLDYYFSYDPRSLDPALSTDVPTGEVVTLLFDNLTQFDADARLKPGLARSWEASADGRVYTFIFGPTPASMMVVPSVPPMSELRCCGLSHRAPPADAAGRCIRFGVPGLMPRARPRKPTGSPPPTILLSS